MIIIIIIVVVILTIILNDNKTSRAADAAGTSAHRHARCSELYDVIYYFNIYNYPNPLHPPPTAPPSAEYPLPPNVPHMTTRMHARTLTYTHVPMYTCAYTHRHTYTHAHGYGVRERREHIKTEDDMNNLRYANRRECARGRALTRHRMT